MSRAMLLIVACLFLILLPGCASSDKQPIPDGVHVDKVLVEKKDRRLTLYSQGKIVKSYIVALGRNPVGPKEKAGDLKTPEGIYRIDSRNSSSHYHRALHVSYPNAADVRNAKGHGYSTGGNIMIHGITNGLGWVGRFHRWVDWTQGCIALTDEEIDEIARVTPDGTPVEIRP